MSSGIVALLIINEVLQEEKEEENIKTRKKRIWRKEWYGEKELYSNQKLLKKLKETEPLDYKNFMRMNDEMFQGLLAKVINSIKKQDTIMRDAISAETRLSITLRFLATGNSFEDIKFSTAVSPQAIGQIVIETCKAIINALKDFIKLPRTAEEWNIVAEKFYNKSKFPHCIGALDGKHVHIKRPSHSGSLYFNYKKTFSIVLMAIVNSESDFLMVEVGSNGRISDGGVFLNTKFSRKLENNDLNLPEPTAVVPGGHALPYTLVSDDAFALRENVMKPFAHCNLTSDEVLFNKKLSAARVRVENAFGILSSRFRVLHTTINLSPEKATIACCYLHNFLRRHRGSAYTISEASSSQYVENSTLTPLEVSTSRNPSLQAKIIRKNFCETIKLLKTMEST